MLVEGKRAPYQRAGVAEFWTPEEMVRSLEGRIEPPTGDYLVFSGTVVTLGRALIFADTWTIRLIDPARGERIEHTYRVPILSREVR